MASLSIEEINEPTQLWFTIHNMIEELRHSYWKNAEIIVVDNGSKPEELRLIKRMMNDRNIKNFGHKLICVPKQLHSKPAINIGAWKAKGEYLTFFDCHCLCSRHFFERTAEFLDRNPDVAILHSPISWYGWNPREKGYQYKLHLEDRFWGGWRNKKVSHIPYPIATTGVIGMTVRRKFFMEVKGYPSMLRHYGGGEPYLDFIAWMFGHKVYLHPDLHTYHFALCRGRDYHRDSGTFFRNIVLCAYICSGEEYPQILLKKAIEKCPRLEKNYRKLYAEALKYGRLRRQFVVKNAKMTLNQILEKFKRENIFH